MGVGLQLEDGIVDAVLAIHVFGYHWAIAMGSQYRYLENPADPVISPIREAPATLPLCRDWHRQVPRFTTSWEATGMLFDAVEGIRLDHKASGSAGVLASVVIYEAKLTGTVFGAWQATGPQAISRAVLQSIDWAGMEWIQEARRMIKEKYSNE